MSKIHFVQKFSLVVWFIANLFAWIDFITANLTSDITSEKFVEAENLFVSKRPTTQIHFLARALIDRLVERLCSRHCHTHSETAIFDSKRCASAAMPEMQLQCSNYWFRWCNIRSMFHASTNARLLDCITPKKNSSGREAQLQHSAQWIANAFLFWRVCVFWPLTRLIM